MAVWLVRAGKHCEAEQIALEKGLVTVGFNEFGNLSAVANREDLAMLFRAAHPDASEGKTANHVGQLWAFCRRISLGDLVVLPLKSRSAVAVGRITGPYDFTSDYGDQVRHIRRVEWLRTDLPRATFDQDLLYSFGAFMTVCQIERNQAEERIRAIVSGQQPVLKKPIDPGEPPATDSAVVGFDIEQAASDQLLDYIQRRFGGHELATLVDAVLKAEGYLTKVSPPGPDGGVDILAGTGPMGLGPPRLCVQVKSSAAPADVNILRGLQGVLQNFHAEHGLLVCWGGYKSSVITEARQSFFTIRLWDSGDLLEMILRNHDKFSDDLKAELPLKRVWALVLEDQL
jgi:restriction system protein